MTTLWDTTGTAVVKALAAERRTGGAVTSGMALTLVVVVDHQDVEEAEEAASIAASRHPMRMLMVIRRQIERHRSIPQPPPSHRIGLGESVEDNRPLDHARPGCDRDMLAFVNNLAVNLVREHNQVMLDGQFCDPGNVLFRQHATGRIARTVDDQQFRPGRYQ